MKQVQKQVQKNSPETEHQSLAFGPVNFILLGISMAVIILGFILMGGDSTSEKAFNPDIFSKTRIVIAPFICLVGFLFMIVAVMYKQRKTEKYLDEEE